jgi:hypothetical protein
MALAALTALGADLGGLLDTIGVSNVYAPVAFAVLGAVVRVLEGVRDSNRAAAGKIISSDVGFDIIRDELADNPEVHNVRQTNEDTIMVTAALPPSPFGTTKTNLPHEELDSFRYRGPGSLD